MTIKDLNIGQTGVITVVGGEGSLRQHFLDMGVIPGAAITVVKYAPMGDPVELMVHGYKLTLRLDDAAKIEVIPAEGRDGKVEKAAETSKREHPGLGELKLTTSPTCTIKV